jgi:tRNA(Ile)-lysidine synthase
VHLRVAVAASGGRDSTALLHCTVRQASALGIEVVALHVHHGLMPGADSWLAQVRSQCRRWGAGFMSRHLTDRPAPGASVEAWARRGRYRALADMAHEAGCGLVLLAHHRRDQAETWLLQALRGAGPAGLAAMPGMVCRADILWARPWLACPREAVENYVRRHRLRYAEDDSNADPRFARNRLRLGVWPALVAAFADAETTIAASAARAGESAALAAEVAALDLPALREGHRLRVPAWLALPPARRCNALRAWLAGELHAPIPETLVARLQAELPATRAARWPAPGAELRLHRDLLGAATKPAPVPSGGGPVGQTSLDLSRCGVVEVAPWRGRFVVEPAQRDGATPALLGSLQAQDRAGNERFRLAPRAVARSLKKQFQARAVPAWERHGPLLFTPDGRLFFVPGLGIEASFHVEPGQPQLQLRWLPDDPAASRSCPRGG